MQRCEVIPFDSIGNIIEAIYDGNPTVFEAYSAFQRDIRYFPTKESLMDLISEELATGNKHKFIYCFLHYPEVDGFIRKKRMQLNPKKCDGATFRYTSEGWGLIQFQLDVTDQTAVKCTLAVSSEKRANNWAALAPELKSPELWNWSVIEKNIGRLIRVLRKNAKAK